MQDTVQEKARALLDKYKSGAFDADPARKERAKALLGQLRQQLDAPGIQPLPGLPGSAPAGPGATQNVEPGAVTGGYNVFEDIGKRGIGPVASEQIELALEHGQKALGEGITQLGEFPGRAATLILGQPYDPAYHRQTGGPERALMAMGEWLADTHGWAPEDHATALTEGAKMVGGALPMAASALLGPEGPAIVGGAQSAAGGLQQGQEAQAAAPPGEGPTNAQVALHTLLSGALGAGAGKVFGGAPETWAGRTIVPGAATMLQAQATGLSAQGNLGAPAPSLKESAMSGVAVAGLGALGHAVSPHPVAPDTLPGRVVVEADPSSPAVKAAYSQGAATDLNAIVDHLRAQAPNTEVGLTLPVEHSAEKGYVHEQVAGRPATQDRPYTGPTSAADMQHALWADNQNIAELAFRHEITSSPQAKLQARQELEETLKQHLTPEQIAGINKWRHWADENREAVAKARASLPATERTGPVALKEILPGPADQEAVGQWQDVWRGDRDVAFAKAKIAEVQHETALKGLVPRETVAQSIERLRNTGRRETQAYADAHLAMLLRVNAGPLLEKRYAEIGNRLTPEQRRIAEMAINMKGPIADLAETVRKENYETGKIAEEHGLIQEAGESYAAQLWKPRALDDLPQTSTAKFTLTSGRFKARVYETILDGWADGRELAVRGLFDSQRISTEQVHQVIADRKLMELGLKTGLFSTNQGEGWVEIKHPNFRVKDESTPTPGWKSVYAAPKDAKFLNNALGTSALYEIPGAKGLTAFTNAVKQMNMLLSPFHYFALTTAHVLTTPEWMKSMNPLGLRSSYKAGQEHLKALSPQAEQLVRNSFTVGKAADYEAQHIADRTIIGQKIDDFLGKLPDAGFTRDKIDEIRNVLLAARDQQHHFLFSEFAPSYKLNNALIEFANQIHRKADDIRAGKITTDQIAEGVSKVYNSLYQSQNLVQLNRNPSLQHAFRLLRLAPDWEEGLLRFAYYGGKGLLRRPGFENELAARIWGRALTRSLFATAAANTVMSMFDERTNKQRYIDAYNSADGGLAGLMRSGFGVDISPIAQKLWGDPNRIYNLSILGQYTRSFDIAERGPGALRGGMSAIGRIVTDAITGTDYAGRPFTSWQELFGVDMKGIYSTAGVGREGEIHMPGDEKGGQLLGQLTSRQSENEPGIVGWNQMPSYAVSEASTALPFEMQSMLSWLVGQQDAFSAMTKGLGLKVSSADRGSMMRRMIQDRLDHTKSLAEKKALEAELRLFNKQAALKGLQGH